MTRLIIDPGVLLAATVVDSDTPTALLLEAVKRGTVEMVICEQLLDDVRRGVRCHLFRGLLESGESDQFLDVLAHIGLRIDNPVLPPRVVRDPGDDYLVALAYASNADAIVTGDRDLLDHANLFPQAIDPREAASAFDLTWFRPSLSPRVRTDWDGPGRTNEAEVDQWQSTKVSLERPRKVHHEKREKTSRAEPTASRRDEHEGSLAPLYRALPRRIGIDRDDVARNQRARMYGGMIEAVSQRGYHATTVAHVVALAGVSRRAFYEQFSNKEECFLATHDIVISRERKHMLDAWKGERGWANRLYASCKVLLDEIAESPKGTRLVLVDSLGIGPKGRERMQLAGFMFERLVNTAFNAAPDGVAFTQLNSRAVVGGVRRLAFAHVLEGRERELPALIDEILDWMGSYRHTETARLVHRGSDSPATDTSPSPATFLASDDMRARILGSVVHLTLDEGYARLTDQQIAQFAGISIKDFHEQFENREECFFAIVDEFSLEALASVTESIQSAATWPEAVCSAVVTFTDHLVAHQALVRLAFIDLFEVGPGMISRLTKPVEDFTKLLTENGPAPYSGPGIAGEAVAGAIWAIISSYVANDRISRLPALVDQIAFTVLAPYIGPSQAIQAIRRKP